MWGFLRCVFAVSGTAFVLLGADPPSTPQDAFFGSLPVVEAAALHAQTLQEAPANVTIVTQTDIRRYGYRTLDDCLNAVRGFYTSYDRIYHYVGVSGFSFPGDYNTRFLVMLNGHPLTSGVYNSNGAFGQDFGLDLDLVERIEVIRGPTSALYGSNGILANINIVTRSPVDAEHARITTETGSYGERKASASASVYLGRGVNMLVAASVFNNGGSSLRFPGQDGPVDGVDGEKGYHSFLNLVWHNWSVSAFFNNRVKQPPVPWGAEAVFYHRGESVRDARNFLNATRSGDLAGGRLRWQVYFDQYKYDDRFDYPRDEGGFTDVRSTARGESVGTQLSWQRSLRLGELTLGGVANGDVRNLQQDHDAFPEVLYSPAIRHPDITGGLFAQQQWQVSPAFTVYGGLRLDGSRNFGASLSPRLAVVWQASPRSTWKAVYGRPFRNPSAFESYYTDGGKAFLANPDLRSETAQTLELSFERKLLSALSMTAAVYGDRLENPIQAVFRDDGVTLYENTGRFNSQGIQLELNGTLGSWLETNASWTFQRARQSATADAITPRHIGKFRAATPLFGRRVWLSASLQGLSARQTLSQAWLRPVALADATFSTSRLHPNFDLLAGVRNLAGWRYSDPVGLGVDQMAQNGRSWFVKLIYHTKE
jgi:outer membrane cobalamin receptor